MENHDHFQEIVEPFPTEHPLLNDVVLRELFKYIAASDLKSCRSVCQAWNKVSIPFVQAIFEVKIIQTDSSSCKNKRTPRLKQFLKLVRPKTLPIPRTRRQKQLLQLVSPKTLPIPFQKFMIGNFDPTSGVGQEFFNLCGATITKLDFYKFGETHSIQNLASILALTPNLQTLKLPLELNSKNNIPGKLFSGPIRPELNKLSTLVLGGDPIDDWEASPCPTFFDELLSVAPNISSLLTAEEENQEAVLKVMSILESQSRESILHTLAVTRVDREMLDVVKTMCAKPRGLELRNLCIFDVRSNPQGTMCFELAELVKHALLSFKLDEVSEVPFQFPRMEKLKYLDVGVRRYEEIIPDLSFGDFAQSFPTLEYLKLHITQIFEEGDIPKFRLDGVFDGSNSCPSLSSLDLGRFLVSPNTMDIIVVVFPNLKALKIELSKGGAPVLPKIWTNLKNLEYLDIYGRLTGRPNINSLVTGISGTDIRKIRGKKTSALLGGQTICGRLDEIAVLNKDYGSLPSIRNLIGLRHLTLRISAVGSESYMPTLNDATGMLGIYPLMNNLKYLYLSNCKFTDRCANLLVRDMNLECWSFKNPCNRDFIISRLRLWPEEDTSGYGRDVIPPRWFPDSDSHWWDQVSPKFEA